ncbi:hypothetical protein IAT38_007890 [Cryptococcus sp. DSM 104549]
MFTSLGLFATNPCPDPQCSRLNCFFSHGSPSSSGASSSKLPQKNSTQSSTQNRQASSGESVAKRKADGEATAQAAKARKLEEAARPPKPAGTAARIAAARPEGPVAKPSTSLQPAKAAPAETFGPVPVKGVFKDVPKPAAKQVQTGAPPDLPIHTKVSPQPRTDRQKGLTTLYRQYAKLYEPVLHLSPDLAHTSALAQEADTSSSSSTLTAYKLAIHQAAVQISRRPPPTSLAHPSIGTVKESRAKAAQAEKEAAGKLGHERLEKYLLKLEDFGTWRYPDPRDERLWGPEAGSAPNGEGENHTCERCKVPFVVSGKNLEERFGECRYHYGRTAPERVEGRRKWIYSCCGKERGEAGCEDGVHVFSDGEDDVALARRVGFMTVRQCVEQAKGKGKGVEVGEGAEVVAMDCEMINTTGGLSLGRVTVVDDKGDILLDELVRQKVPILDVNTRFSGLTRAQLEGAVMDLPAVRAAACMFIGPKTMIVGHGLENDLRAMRLLHDRVIDTAVVFPHDKGPPYRRALRDIVKEKLGYFIQDRTSDLGHSSAVDAIATLEALKWKVREDNE